MATKKISEFTTLGSLSDNDILPVVSSGANKKITASVLKTYAQNGGVNLGNITFDNDTIGSTNNVVNILASDYAQLESNGNYLWVDNTGLHLEVNTGEGGNTFVFEHDTGVSRLRLPEGGDIVDSNGVSVLGGGGGVSLPANAQGFLANDGTGTLSWSSAPASLVSPDGNFEVTLDNTGAIVLSSYGVIKNLDHVNMVSDGWVQMQWVDTNTLENADPNATSGPTNWIYVDGNGIHVETNVNMNIGDSTQRYDWLFDNYGKLIMPNGGDIVNSNGTSVLGGGVTLPATATGYLNNDGNGTLSWSAIDYNSLINTPSIPSLVNADWNEIASESPAYIFNKPTIPTNTSELNNDSGFITNEINGSLTRTETADIASGTAVVWTGNYTWTTSAKLTLQVECSEQGNSGWQVQVCEAILATRGGEPVMTVYGVTHTSVDPLVTFTVQRNQVTGLIEVLGTLTATAINTAYLRIHSVEMTTRD